MPQKFKLLAGQHVEADRDRPILDPEGKPTGRFARKTYKAGDVVESETDLAARLGANKFEKLDEGGDRARIAELERQLAEARAALPSAAATAPSTAPAAAPGGQVSDGFQRATGSPGGTASGPLPEADFGRAGVAGAAPAGKGDGPDFEAMTVAQLKEHAEAEEIDLRGATHKDEIIKRVRGKR